MSDYLQSVALLLFALLLVFLNGFFVAAEFALVKVRATRIDELAAKNRFGAKKAQQAVHHLDAYLSATQLGVTLSSLGLGYIGEPAFAALFSPLLAGLSEAGRHVVAGTVAFTIITSLHIVIGELAPKSLAIQKAERTTLAVIYPLDLFYRLFRLPIACLNGMANLVLRPLGLTAAGEHDGEAHSEEELRMIVNASHAGGEIQASEVQLVNRVLDFAHQQARDIMVPRPDVVFLDRQRPLEEALTLADATGFTRYPLCDGSPDRVVGMVHIKQLLAQGRHTPPEAPIQEQIVRPILHVPETKPIEQMLREMQRERQHMAVVLDEYGGTAGIVTLEDIVEEIVGDIQDEFERASPEMEPAGRDCYLVDARMPLEKLQRALNLATPEDEYEVDTVGGWVLATLGDAPLRTGLEVPYGEATFVVTETAGRRVRAVRICVPEPSEAPRPQ